jgi:hypothetical protein
VVYLLVNGQPVQVKSAARFFIRLESVLVEGDIKEGDLIILNPPSLMARLEANMDWVIEARNLKKPT